MKAFSENYMDEFQKRMQLRKPDFNNLLKVLNKEKPDRFTLFEFFMNNDVYKRLSGYEDVPGDIIDEHIMRIKAFKAAGYDYYNLHGSNFNFKTNVSNHGKKSRSMSEDAIIQDREDYESYVWNEPDNYDMSRLEVLREHLPEGMKLIVYGPGGVLENVIQLMGYEGLCYHMSDDPELVSEIFDSVGSRLLRYYELALEHDAVGACVSNDDWGFNTQTMLSPDDMRKYVFKWHKKITDTIHKAGRPVILHSCGNLISVHGDIINDMKYDGKHSYEDKITPVEEAYEQLNPKIAVLGGIDLDFVCRKTPREIYERACRMLEISENRGGYALGTGNSVPYYTPYENYIAMISAVVLNS